MLGFNVIVVVAFVTPLVDDAWIADTNEVEVEVEVEGGGSVGTTNRPLCNTHIPIIIFSFRSCGNFNSSNRSMNSGKVGPGGRGTR